MSLKALSDYTVYSRYAHYLPEKKRRETWEEITERVFAMHARKYAKPLQESEEFRADFEFAKDMVKKKRVLGSQRALQFGGSWIEKANAKLYNCSFTYIDRPAVFQEIEYLLLCGCGVGFSVQKHHVKKLPNIEPVMNSDKAIFVIPDSIAGWADAIGVLINSYFSKGTWEAYAGKTVVFDYSQIRPEGALIAGQFKAPGHKGLMKSLEKIRALIERRLASPSFYTDEFANKLRPIDVYDLVMFASDSVLSGGIRRSATISLFSHDDAEMMAAKTGNWFIENPQRGRSNNSVLLVRGETTWEQFKAVMDSTRQYGEPGFYFASSTEHGANPCVRGDTLILTRDGNKRIDSLVGKEIDIWNGYEWSSVVPRITGENQKMLKVTLKDGRSLVCTYSHEWLLKTNQGGSPFTRVKAGNLYAGDFIWQPDGSVSVLSIEDFGTEALVYCFTESLRNLGTFNNILTAQCVEIGLFPQTVDGRSGVQFCNLCEINGKPCDTPETFYDSCRAAAILGTMQAGYTDFAYLSAETKEITEREALLGVSITGVMDNPDTLLSAKVQRAGAQVCKETNARVAKLLGINPAARITCTKPAGCQKPDTLVSTKQGILRLDEIGDTKGSAWQSIGLEVNTDESVKKSSKFFVNGKAKTKKILLDSGLEIEATHNHQYRVLTEDGEYVWKRSDTIREGDLLPYRVGEYNGGAYQPLSYNGFPFKKGTRLDYKTPIRYPKIIDEEFAWFLGLYIGDGSNHKTAIRIHGDQGDTADLIKAQSIIDKLFGINGILENSHVVGHKGCHLSIGSRQFIDFLKDNALLKPKSANICVPVQIRRSPKSVIKAFIDGYAAADGSIKTRDRTFCTVSKRMAEEMVVILRAVGIDSKLRLMPPTPKSYGKRMRYWISERKGRSGCVQKIQTYHRAAYPQLDELGLTQFSVDKVISVSDSISDTYDIEVDDVHCYLANSYVSHNSTSCVLQTASGIHPHHARRYLRRVQANRLEFPLTQYKKTNPLAVEPSVWSANGTDEVISFACEVPKGAILKNDLDATVLLSKVKSSQMNWVLEGENPELAVSPGIHHNISNTITVREDEWDKVNRYIYDNREFFTGISLLGASGDLDYPQAPFATVLTPEEIVKEYGEGSILASGLVVDGLRAFDDNLWVACDAALGLGQPLVTSVEPIEPDKPKGSMFMSNKAFTNALADYAIQLNLYYQAIYQYKQDKAKHDWVRRVKQFAERYFNNDTRKATYCLKHVSLWHTWLGIRRTHKDIDWAKAVEETESHVNADTLGAQACAGGACSLS